MVSSVDTLELCGLCLCMYRKNYTTPLWHLNDYEYTGFITIQEFSWKDYLSIGLSACLSSCLLP